MYEFHYDYIKPKYGDDATTYAIWILIHLSITSKQKIFTLISRMMSKVDLIQVGIPMYRRGIIVDYRPLRVGRNKKVLGKMKDELGGKIMTEFVALRSKLYAYRKFDGTEDKRAKGTKKCVVDKTIKFQNYKDCLENGKEVYRNQLLFKSDHHRLYTLNIRKVALSANDDKRVIRQDGISTRAIGYQETEE